MPERCSKEPQSETIHHSQPDVDPFYFFDQLPACVRKVLISSDYTAPDITILMQCREWIAAGRTAEQYAAALQGLFDCKRRERELQLFSGNGEEDIV